jgi:hypothetical protein
MYGCGSGHATVGGCHDELLFSLTFMMNYCYLIGAKGTQYHQLHAVPIRF